MAFKINLSVSNKTAYTILVIFLILSVGVIVYAYGTNNPSSIGHSAGEVMVSISGMNKTIQQAIDDGDFSGAGTIQCELIGETTKEESGQSGLKTVTVPNYCKDGKICILKLEAFRGTPSSFDIKSTRIRIHSQDNLGYWEETGFDPVSGSNDRINGDSVYTQIMARGSVAFLYDDYFYGSWNYDEKSIDQWTIRDIQASWASRLYACSLANI